MTHALSPDQTRRLRTRAQRLHLDGAWASSDVAQLLRDVCGVQAQDQTAALLAVWVRGDRLTAAQVARAQAEARSIVRTWCMRGTLHLLAAEDLGWLLQLFGPVFVRKSRRRYAELGLSEELCLAAIHAMRDILSGRGPSTRAELAQELTARGFPTAGQAAYHLLRRAGLEGVVCFGPDRAGEPTYVLLDDWARVGRAMAADAARAELARRYLQAYGPARPEDLASWSGLSIREARAGFSSVAGELLEVEVQGSPAWILKRRAAWLDEARDDAFVVRLLPGFDPYLLGYRARDLTVPGQYARRVHPGGGVLHPTLLVDGIAAGTWKLKRGKTGLVISVDPWNPLGLQVKRALEDQVRDLGRFYQKDATLSIQEPGR